VQATTIGMALFRQIPPPGGEWGKSVVGRVRVEAVFDYQIPDFPTKIMFH